MNEIEKAIKHFEGLQKRYTTQHNGAQCELVKTALSALREKQERKDPQPSKAYCVDCGMEYGGEDWTDTVLSNEQWELIFPEKYGILCANCIIKRASRLEGIIRADMNLVFADDINDPQPKEVRS